MAMNMAGSSGGGRRGRRRAVMAEINVTPMVDVMLVLLIIFMVSAPLLTVGVPLDLPQTQAKSLDQDKNPLTLAVNLKGEVFLNDTQIALNDLVPKLKAITDARGGLDERIFVRGDKKVDYGTVMKVMGRLSQAGFRRVAYVKEVDQGYPHSESRQDIRCVVRTPRPRDRMGADLLFRALARSAAAGIDAGRHHFRRSAFQDHRGHQDRRKGQAEANGRKGRRANAGRGRHRQGHRKERNHNRHGTGAAAKTGGKAGREEARTAQAGRREQAKGRAESRKEAGSSERGSDRGSPEIGAGQETAAEAGSEGCSPAAAEAEAGAGVRPVEDRSPARQARSDPAVDHRCRAEFDSLARHHPRYGSDAVAVRA